MASYWETPFQDPDAPKAPAAKAPAEPEVSVGEDVAKSAVGGAARGTTGLLGLPGNLTELMRTAGERVGDALGLKPLPADVAAANERARVKPPTSADIQRSVEGYTGEFYQPKTTAGKYTSTIAEFAPSAFVPGLPISRLMSSSIPGLRIAARSLPEVIAGRAINTVAPAVASETAGQLTEGTPFEPYARMVAGVAGVPAARLAARSAGEMMSLDPTRLMASAASGSGLGYMFGLPGATVGAVAPILMNPASRTRLANELTSPNTRDAIARSLIAQSIAPDIGPRVKAEQEAFERKRTEERRRLGLQR